MRKVRAVSGAADQVFSSLSNGLIIYAVAVVTPSHSFGQIALLLTLLAGAVGAQRGALGTSLLLMAGRSSTDIRREGSFAVTTALLASPVVGAVMWLVAGPAIRLPAIVIIIATPIVLVEDVLRYVAIAEDRAHVAALWDGLWFAGSAALLGATWLHVHVATTNFLLVGWTALAFCALLGLLIAVSVTPRFKQYSAWITDDWRHRVRYGVDSGLEQVIVFAVMLFAAVVLNPAVAAALRGAAALLAPVAIAANAVPLAVIPESRRQNMAPAQVWKALTRITVVTSSGALLIGAVLVFIPVTIGQLVLGRTFESAQAIIPIVAFEYALGSWFAAGASYLRAFNRSADALMFKICYLVSMFVAVAVAGLLFHTAAGIATGGATAMTFCVALTLLLVRPWAKPASDSDAERGERLAPRPNTAASRTVAHRDGLDAGVAAPLPLATRLRLHTATQTHDALITAWVFAVLAVVGPVLIINFTGNPPTLSWLWALPATIICSARFAWLMGSGQRRLYEVMFWSFTYMFFCLAPLVQLRENEWPGTVPRMDNTYIGAGALIVIVGCCAFLAGVGLDTLAAQRRPSRAVSRSRVQVAPVTSINFSRTVVLCLFSTVLTGYFLSKVSWLPFLHTRYEMQDIEKQAFPIENEGVVLSACCYMALLVSFVALVRFRNEAKTALRLGESISAAVMRSNMALLVVIGLLLANSMNPISNARYQSGTAMLAVATAYGLFGTVRRFRWMSCGFLAALLVVFPLADAFRSSQEAELKANNPIDALMSDDYDSFAQLMNGYLISVRDGVVVGKQFLGVVFWWLPRSIWPGKPVDTGIYIANMRGYSFTNLSAPLWVELFLNGGWIVLTVGMFVIGFGLHRWDTGLNSQFEDYDMPGVLGCILPFYMMILLRGSLLQAASFLFFIGVFAAFIRQRKPKDRPRDTVRVEASAWGRQRIKYASA